MGLARSDTRRGTGITAADTDGRGESGIPEGPPSFANTITEWPTPWEMILRLSLVQMIMMCSMCKFHGA